MHDKLELFEGRIRDGHAPFLEEGDLQAYAMAGIATDHECSFFDYAMRERRNGLTILVREGSAARNLEALVGGLVQRHMNGDGFCFAQMTSTLRISSGKGILTITCEKLSVLA